MAEIPQLLSDYVKNGSEPAFQELVARYVDLVHSTALRLVNEDSHRAEDVTQTVFADLARLARTLSPNVMLGGWLHRHTCFVASNLMRGERRRENRERQAVEMSSVEEDHSEANLTTVAPVLDEAINQLGTTDRQAILLRFYERRDFHSVGEAMGSSEEAARKRVNRALEKLHQFFQRRGIALSIAALGTALSTQAVTAAPIGMGTAVAASALAGAAVTATGTTTFTLLTIMNTKLKIGLATALAVAVAIPLVIQQNALQKERAETAALRQEVQRITELEAENQRLAALAQEAKSVPIVTNDNEPSRELLAARGEAAKWRSVATTPKPSAMSGLTANPEMMKMIHDQQKTALGAIYKQLANELKLPKEQAEKLTNLLADNVMTNIEHICALLAEGKTPQEMDQVFAAQEAALLEQVQGLLGEEGLAEYKDYTRDLLASISAQQFKSMLTGDSAAKEAKSKQLDQLLRQEAQQTLARAGLSSDFQLVPTLNFRNFTSEEEEARNLKLLDEVYANAASQAGSFLTEEDLRKFEEFRGMAQKSNKMILAMNRKLMSPQTQ